MIPPDSSAPAPDAVSSCCRDGGGVNAPGPLRRLCAWWLSPGGLAAGVAGFLAGYWLMWNVELQLLWLAVTVLPGLCRGWRKACGEGLLTDGVVLPVWVLVGWTLAVGLVRHFPGPEWSYRWEYCIGALALPPFLAAVWMVCREGRAGLLLRACAWSGALAAAVSLVWWREVQAVELAGARLRNPLIYGGLHPVATGLFGAFAVVALALSYRGQQSGKGRALLLTALAVTELAMLYTISRGALLAAACGMAVLSVLILLCPGWRRVWPVLPVTAGTAVFFFLWPTALSPVPVEQRVVQGQKVIILETVTDNPAREFLAREDNGRMGFYRLGWSFVDTWDKHLTGAGLWEDDERLERLTAGSANHFHCLPLATYIHSGIPGVLLLLAGGLAGLAGAWRLARQGQGEWLALLACGWSGLVFDGQSACSLVTHPRFEPLLLWVPLVAASAIAGKSRRPQSTK